MGHETLTEDRQMTTSQKNTVEVKRYEALQPYPRNGNVGMQKPAYRWEVVVNGRSVETFPLRRMAVEAAKDYA